MAENYKKLAQVELADDSAAAASKLLYTCTAPVTETIIKHIRLVSTDAGDRTVRIWHTDAVVPADNNIILPAATIDAGGWGEFEGTILMEPGDRLYADCDQPTAVTITVYGLEIE